jgi:hypothetical protein
VEVAVCVSPQLGAALIKKIKKNYQKLKFEVRVP